MISHFSDQLYIYWTLKIFFKYHLDQRFSNFFERDPNLNLLNASRPMPQTTYEKTIIVWMNFSSKLPSLFSMSTIYSFLKYLHKRQTKKSSGKGRSTLQRHKVERSATQNFVMAYTYAKSSAGFSPKPKIMFCCLYIPTHDNCGEPNTCG